MKENNDERKVREELAKQFCNKIEKYNKEVRSKYDEKQKKLIKNLDKIVYGHDDYEDYYMNLLLENMNNKYNKPSDFIKEELDWIFDGYISPDFKEAVYYAVDNSNQYPYDSSYYRRSFRTSTYYTQNIMSVIKSFHEKCIFGSDICKVLTLDLNDEEIAYFYSYSWRTYGYCEEWIAYELDNGNKKLEEVIIDIINGDGEIAISREIIRGIVKSHNTHMYEYLGKLLLAAKLQEGLRQVICENMDMGCIEGFLVLVKVINDNNLIRFSSIKRAIGTWLGLLDYNTSNLERISDKSLDLIVNCIENKELALEYIESEDSMKIYIGLWAIGSREVKDAINIVERLSDSGSHHQILTAGYFCDNLNEVKLAHKLSKNVIKKHNDKYDIIAVYMKHFMSGWSYCKNTDYFFENEDEAREIYNILLNIYSNIPKKSLEYNPCIFSWYTASLTKSDIVQRVCAIARIINDNELIDSVCGLIKECDSDIRARCLKYVLDNPKTKAQKEAITGFLCDRESYTRSEAKKIVDLMDIEEANYLQMEKMLRYKAADIREMLIEFLCEQDDCGLDGTIKRLLADKKEEKRTAGLDMIMQIMTDEDRQDLFTKCLEYVKEMENVSPKEQILINNIIKTDDTDEGISSMERLYDEGDEYIPNISRTAYIDECIDFYIEYFPNSRLKENIENNNIVNIASKITNKEKKAKKDLHNMCESLEQLILEHLEDEYVTYGGEVCTITANTYRFWEKISEDKYDIPFLSMWQEWFNNNVKDYKKLYRMKIYLLSYDLTDEYTEAAKPYVNALFGAELDREKRYKYLSHIRIIVDRLLEDYITESIERKLVVAMSYWYIKCLPEDKVILPYKNNSGYYRKNIEAHFLAYSQVAEIMQEDLMYSDNYDDNFNLAVEVSRKTFAREIKYEEKENNGYYYGYNRLRERYSIVSPNYNRHGISYSRPSIKHYIIASYKGIITQNEMFEYMFREENMSNTLEFLSLIVIAVREKERSVSKRGGYYSWQQRRKDSVVVTFLNKKAEDINEDDEKLLDYCVSIYDKVIEYVLYDELRRGDTETKYSKYINNISRIYGIDNFIAILNALGEDTLNRSTYCYGNITSKKESLSHLLSICIPYDDEDFKIFKEKISKTNISDKRLIEASLYSPEWLEHVEDYLGWDGFKSACYYFMAHMNEQFDDKKKAIIAKYTPITEDELKLGAFDINWFKQAYEALGKKRFDMIYNAAKYISDGSKHARARKYADAVIGKTTKADIESKINDKRNKDLVMAYGLLPFNNENDIFERYLFIQGFIKGSKKFGAQRIASEKAAAEIAMSNLAINAGYSDVIRLTLQMETKLLENSKELFEDKVIDEIVLKLSVDNGKVNIICIKNGKQLKSIPAKYKKDEYVVRLKETKKRLTEQYKRTKIMFEQAMEDETVFRAEEIINLYDNKVVSPIVSSLVYKIKDKNKVKLGFIVDGKFFEITSLLTNNILINEVNTDVAKTVNKKIKEKKIDGAYVLKPNTEVIVAHPYDLYMDGHWIDYQQYLFDNKIVQSFKQVFRELYVKTDEEKGMNNSRRYSGHQIQPQKTVACLKTRRWIADIEDGLQKVYYKENIVARMYAMADWFTPADIEAPTLEWVEFSDRKTGKLLEISTIPDVIFSEVMRDVDLAVSVAHVGGVDPETSHSTVEMRASLISFTLPLFKIDNVKINDNHAVIDGYYGTYMVNLGSGVVHKKGGAMIPILPVHSQHRGKIFLPFADDDPKTAEIITKILTLAEDKKIKDPTILDYIR